jgi:hypothetical protein
VFKAIEVFSDVRSMQSSLKNVQNSTTSWQINWRTLFEVKILRQPVEA